MKRTSGWPTKVYPLRWAWASTNCETSRVSEAYSARMTASSSAETRIVYRAGAVSTPSITNVSFSISLTARLASFLNEKGSVYPWGDVPKTPAMRSSNMLKKFICRSPALRWAPRREQSRCT